MLCHKLEVDKFLVLESLRGLDMGLTDLNSGFLEIDSKVLGLEVGWHIVDVGNGSK